MNSDVVARGSVDIGRVAVMCAEGTTTTVVVSAYGALQNWRHFPDESTGERVFHVVVALVPEPEGWYSAYSPSLPGAHSQGENAEAALKNIQEAIAGLLESYIDEGKPIPWNRTDVPPNPNETRYTVLVRLGPK